MSHRIHAKHLPYSDGHLGKVHGDMEEYGAPTIKAIRFEGGLFALEGSHRLALAHEAGVTPKIVIVEPDIEGADDFFRSRVASLPVYEFDHILCLEERSFL